MKLCALIREAKGERGRPIGAEPVVSNSDGSDLETQVACEMEWDETQGVLQIKKEKSDGIRQKGTSILMTKLSHHHGIEKAGVWGS